MAEFINYGDLQIDLQELLNTLANLVQGYVSKQSWSNKRKEKFMTAYTDLMNRGIVGASNASGQWLIDVNGDSIDLDSMSRKDKEMYLEAAYFIQLQMASIPTQKKEEDNKADLPVFDNTYFTTNLGNHISNRMFGGREFDTKTDWNSLDARDDKGIRGNTVRANKLADMLQSYSDSLEEGLHNFDGSPFESLGDFKSRVNTAIQALRSGNKDSITASLNAIGLRTSDWFNNGSGDEFTLGDYTGTYGDYYGRYLPEQQAALLKLKKEQAKANAAKVKQMQENNKRWVYRVRVQNPVSLEQLANKYGNTLLLMGKIQEFLQRGLKNLSLDETIDLVSAFTHAANLPISDEEWSALKNTPSLKNADRSRFRKLAGINNLVYDSTTGHVVSIYGKLEKEAFDNLPNDFLQGLSTESKQLEYLNNTKWTADLTRELAGIAADVASVIDPEPFSAGALALTGTGLRTYNRFNDADGFTWTDAGYTALDAGLSLLGMIPIVGDAALAARVIGKLQKAAGWLGVVFAAASTPQAAKAAWNKVVNGLDMTVDDWRAIGNVLMGTTQARRIQLNRAAGNVVKNSAPGTRTEKFGEVEVKIGGKTEKVEIDEAAAKELQQAYKNAGRDLQKTSEALRNSRAVRELLQAKKGSDGKPAYTKAQLDKVEAPQAALGSVKGRAKMLARDSDIRGIKVNDRVVLTAGTPIPANAPARVRYAQNTEGIFRRSNFGWNINGNGGNGGNLLSWFKNMWNRFKNPYAPLQTPTTSTTTGTHTTTGTTTTPPPKSTKLDVSPYSKRGARREYINTILKHKFSNNSSKLGNGESESFVLQTGEGTTHTFTFTRNSDGSFMLKVDYKNRSGSGGNSSKVALNDVKLHTAKLIASIIKNTGNTTKHKLIAKFIRELKKAGYLHLGGTIDRTRINKYKEFISK